MFVSITIANAPCDCFNFLGLQKLRILSCNELTTEGFLEAISFRDLRELTLIIEAVTHLK